MKQNSPIYDPERDLHPENSLSKPELEQIEEEAEKAEERMFATADAYPSLHLDEDSD